LTAAVEHAYRHCQRLTREAAGNFYYGIRLLPRHKRRAMCAVYAFARGVDDIGDGDLPVEQKLDALQARAIALDGLSPQSPDLVSVALSDAARRFPLPLDALYELIEGVRMDVAGTRYEHLDELLLYCRHVAGGIGRLCVGVFGSSQLERAWSPANDLGIAMQLTNILRDLAEDAHNGRVYLPRNELVRFGVLSEATQSMGQDACQLLAHRGKDGKASEELQVLICYQAARAREWFDRGQRLLPMLDRRSTACVPAMSGIYRRLLRRLESDPSASLHGRVALPASEKAWVALCALGGVAA
jgi:15-cis-phytoene synthase